MKTLNLRNSIHRAPFRSGLLFSALVVGCFALSPIAQAKPHPTPTPTATPAGEDRGNGNTAAENVEALISLTTGINNTASGWQSLFSNTEGNDNTATGFQALYFNTGFRNTANGVQALQQNSTGSNNTANGWQALFGNTTGNRNTATGFQALLSNTTGGQNTANGLNALSSNTSGESNAADGASALSSNTTGNSNTANGAGALSDNTTGSFNVALGVGAGGLLTTGDNNIDIGNLGLADEASTIRIGSALQTRTFIAGISGTAVAGDTVVVDPNGHLGVLVSSERFKDVIKPMNKASEAILALKPVTFRYKQTIDPKGIPQFGLIAEEVAQVNPNLVVRDAHGAINTVRYEAVNAMLLNEFLKAHRRIEEQDKRMDQLTAKLKDQALLIQKVNDKVELNRAAPQTVANDQ